MIIDVATLTGAVITALGHEIAAVLGNDETLISALDKAGKQSGERIWPLPLLPAYREDMNSDFADIANLSKSGRPARQQQQPFYMSLLKMTYLGPIWILQAQHGK